MIARDHPEYEIRYGFSVNELGCKGIFMDVPLAVYDHDELKLLIMIIGKTTPSHREYIRTIEETDRLGLNVLIFRRYLENTDRYIADRLQKFL